VDGLPGFILGQSKDAPLSPLIRLAVKIYKLLLFRGEILRMLGIPVYKLDPIFFRVLP